ncbi:MAG: hypothetical protein QRY71_01580 [Candidatus Rhabdochlamydia sp.]
MMLKKLTSLVITLHIIFIFFLVTPPSHSRKKLSSSVKIRTTVPLRNPSLAVKNLSQKSSSAPIKGASSSSISLEKKSSSPAQLEPRVNPRVKVEPSSTPSSQKKLPNLSVSSKTISSKSASSVKTQAGTNIKPSPVELKKQQAPSQSLKTPSSLAAKPLPKAASSPKVIDASQKPRVPQSSPPSPVVTPSPIEPSSLSSFEAWKEIEEALAKIEEKSYPKTQTPSWGSSIAVVPDDVDHEEESSYSPHALFSHEGALSEEDLVVGFLYTSLHLPESGDVKVSLTLRADGTVKELKILNAESGKNRLYLEKNLPKLRFPVKKPEEKTWIFNFCHEV